jgi:endogenous inhibitor of DNA gyrase (YacG/DUF329 family)
MTKSPLTTSQRAGPRCPLCAKPAALAYRPFCSRRCADVDLQRWLSGAYVVPGAADEDGAAGTPFPDDEA